MKKIVLTSAGVLIFFPAKTEYSKGLIKSYDVVSVPGNTLGIFSRRKHVLTQVEHSDVLIVRMFGE